MTVHTEPAFHQLLLRSGALKKRGHLKQHIFKCDVLNTCTLKTCLKSLQSFVVLLTSFALRVATSDYSFKCSIISAKSDVMLRCTYMGTSFRWHDVLYIAYRYQPLAAS